MGFITRELKSEQDEWIIIHSSSEIPLGRIIHNEVSAEYACWELNRKNTLQWEEYQYTESVNKSVSDLQLFLDAVQKKYNVPYLGQGDYNELVDEFFWKTAWSDLETYILTYHNSGEVTTYYHEQQEEEERETE